MIELLKKYAQAKNLTYTELAKQIGIGKTTLYDYFNQAVVIKDETLNKIHKFFIQ